MIASSHEKPSFVPLQKINLWLLAQFMLLRDGREDKN
jgi:hypothetical protein